MGIKPLKTLQHALVLLEHFTPTHPKRSLAELHKLTGLPKTNIYRVLHTLELTGYVAKEPETSRYHLAMRLFELGSRALLNLDVRELGHRYLRQLHELTGETVMLSVLDDTDVVHIDVISSQDTLRAVSYVGARWPAHATASGLAMLAFSPAEVVDAVIARGLPQVTEHTITDAAALRRVLAESRARGYATNRGGRRAEIMGFGAAILGRKGEVAAGLALSVPVTYVDEARADELAQAVVAVAAAFSRALGYQPCQ